LETTQFMEKCPLEFDLPNDRSKTIEFMPVKIKEIHYFIP